MGSFIVFFRIFSVDLSSSCTGISYRLARYISGQAVINPTSSGLSYPHHAKSPIWNQTWPKLIQCFVISMFLISSPQFRHQITSSLGIYTRGTTESSGICRNAGVNMKDKTICYVGVFKMSGLVLARQSWRQINS